MKIYYDKDANLNHLKGKKIAIIGYGAKGTPRPRTWERVASMSSSPKKGVKIISLLFVMGFKPVSADEAARQCDVIQSSPDHIQAKLYEMDVKPIFKRKNPSIFSWV